MVVTTLCPVKNQSINNIIIIILQYASSYNAAQIYYSLRFIAYLLLTLLLTQLSALVIHQSIVHIDL